MLASVKVTNRELLGIRQRSVFSPKSFELYMIYSFLVHLAKPIIYFSRFFSKKMRLFVDGRKNTFSDLERITRDDKVFWMHAASLGEFEQGLPILERLKTAYPNHKTVLTFFSPSGYEAKKNSGIADVITYMPLDTRAKAKKFLEKAHPQMALFIKYEVWPNFLKELKRNKIPTILVSALFRKNQVYFRSYGGFMRNSLRKFDKIFVQNEHSKELLASIGITDAIISGDTRFDRVAQIKDLDATLYSLKRFTNSKLCFVMGSTWPEDEAVSLDFINRTENLKTVIAPHNIKQKHILDLQININRRTILFSKIKDITYLSDFDVLIIDSIGILNQVYRYADIAYIGGGFKTGLHNTLEPAVFGIPLIIGPHYSKFYEAELLVKKGGMLSISSKEMFEKHMTRLIEDENLRKEMGDVNSYFVNENIGASDTIINYMQNVI